MSLHIFYAESWSYLPNFFFCNILNEAKPLFTVHKQFGYETVIANIDCVPEFIYIPTPFTYHEIQLCGTLNVFIIFHYVYVSMCTCAGACGRQRHGVPLELE